MAHLHAWASRHLFPSKEQQNTWNVLQSPRRAFCLQVIPGSMHHPPWHQSQKRKGGLWDSPGFLTFNKAICTQYCFSVPFQNYNYVWKMWLGGAWVPQQYVMLRGQLWSCSLLHLYVDIGIGKSSRQAPLSTELSRQPLHLSFLNSSWFCICFW